MHVAVFIDILFKQTKIILLPLLSANTRCPQIGEFPLLYMYWDQLPCDEFVNQSHQ